MQCDHLGYGALRQGRKCGGWGVLHPQTYVLVGLQMSAVGLKI